MYSFPLLHYAHCADIQCVGPSMLPTFRENGDLVLVNRYSNIFFGRKYIRGDIVIAWAPYDPEKLICKRVAGVEGQTVVKEFAVGNRKIRTEVVIPPGHVWLLGDNPDNSKDSRQYGPGGLLSDLK